MHWLKTVLFLISLFGLILSAHARSATAKEYNLRPWLITALKLQRQIDLNTPLNEATFIGTHNSYNSKRYQIPMVRYLDPNQTLSIYEQLEAGVRSLELDAHWTLGNNFSYEILLCHGQANHAGCSMFDRPFSEGLKELRNWLKENPDELVLLYIERHLDGQEPKLATLLKEYLGDFIFKPTLIRDRGDSPHACVALLTKLSKADILRAGKQLIIVTKECDRVKTELNDFIFTGIGDIPAQPFTFLDATMNSFTAADCSKSNIFSPDPYHTSLWRIYEDRTIFGSIIERQKFLFERDMKEIMRCGINWPTLDMLGSFDSRLIASIWSWALNYPKEGYGQCSIYKYDEGIKNIPCDLTVAAAYTCHEEMTHTIKAFPLSGPWTDGESTCQKVAGKSWHFAVPINSQQMNALKESMKAQSIPVVWLNYILDQRGQWSANQRSSSIQIATGKDLNG